MSDRYKLKIHTHNPDVAKQLVGGIGLENLLQDSILNLSKKLNHNSFMSPDSPFYYLTKEDFDHDDPLVNRFFDSGGVDLAKKLIVECSKASYDKLVKIAEDNKKFRKQIFASSLRNSYNAVQNFLNSENEAVKLERVASKLSEKSSGSWQIEAIENIDKAVKIASTAEIKSLKFARDLVLTGNRDHIRSASELIKTVFEKNISSTKRLAYTTLGTQDNEPYLMCPKGTFNGMKAGVLMEVSKCRENCIDSRVKDGVVTCAYEDWMKNVFEPQNQVLGRLETHRHPDNEENSLNLKEGERSKKLTEGEFGYEFRLDRNDRGINSVRGKSEHDKSFEQQLANNKPVQWGHQQDDKPKHPRQAQSNGTQRINEQLEPKRTDQKGLSPIEILLNKLNNIDSDHESTREELLMNDGLQAHRGEMTESYPEQLNEEFDENPMNYRDELNKDKKSPSESIIHILNKTAAKDKTNEELLADSRKKYDVHKTQEEHLSERRQNKKVNDHIEALLDANEDWGHQFSEKDLEHFAKELGLDSYLEDKRNEYKLEP